MGLEANEESHMVSTFTFLIALQFLVILCHDLVEIPGWAHTSQMRAVLGRLKLWLATLANSIFPGIAVAFAFRYWNRSKPAFVERYWLIYCAVTVASAIAMWYVPYFWGASSEKKEEYQRYYAGTHQLLPPRGDNPRPNLLHLIFHVLFLATFFLAFAIYLQGH
jgi:Na+/melibiose symporter-like transporter